MKVTLNMPQEITNTIRITIEESASKKDNMFDTSYKTDDEDGEIGDSCDELDLMKNNVPQERPKCLLSSKYEAVSPIVTHSMAPGRHGSST